MVRILYSRVSMMDLVNYQGKPCEHFLTDDGKRACNFASMNPHSAEKCVCNVYGHRLVKSAPGRMVLWFIIGKKKVLMKFV